MKVLVVHGPNINLLGTRETGIYGATTLATIDSDLSALAADLGSEIEIRQLNGEGEMVETIQQSAASGISGILINPAAYGHTSLAVRDALLAVGLPFVEVHLSNIYAREPFRQHTYLSDIASGIIIGLGPQGYLLGLRALAGILAGPRA